MMFGSVFYNFWAALCSFAVYFIWAIQDPFALPLPTIVASLVAAIIGFVIMFIIRFFAGYVFYTPENFVYEELEVVLTDGGVADKKYQEFVPYNERSTVEFDEGNTEDIAQVVRTMLHGQDEAVSR